MSKYISVPPTTIAVDLEILDEMEGMNREELEWVVNSVRAPCINASGECQYEEVVWAAIQLGHARMLVSYV